jgi:hypothetical protein
MLLIHSVEQQHFMHFSLKNKAKLRTMQNLRRLSTKIIRNITLPSPGSGAVCGGGSAASCSAAGWGPAGRPRRRRPCSRCRICSRTRRREGPTPGRASCCRRSPPSTLGSGPEDAAAAAPAEAAGYPASLSAIMEEKKV